jgi:hypothetical protein
MRIALNHQYEAADSAACPPDEPRCPNEFSLYARFDNPPSPSEFDCADTLTGPFHYCEISHPQAGTWHVQALRSIGAGPYQLTVNTSAPCVGDCTGDAHVTVDDILTMVNIALGNAETSECQRGDANEDGRITVDEILQAVNNALNG